MDTAVLLAIIISSVWVYFDARKIGARRGLLKGFFDLSPLSWALACVLLWIVSFPAYLIHRPKIERAAQQGGTATETKQGHIQQSTTNRIAKFAIIGWTIFCAVGLFAGIANLGDVAGGLNNEYEQAGFAIGATMGFGMWLVTWAVITVPATILYFVTKRSTPVVFIEQQEQRQNNSIPTKQCPYCAETIRAEAVFCRYCQKNLATPPATDSQQEKFYGKAQDLIERGTAAIKAGEYKAAILILTKAIEEEMDGSTLYYRAVAYSKMQDKARMQDDLIQAANLGHEKSKEMLRKINASASEQPA